MMKLIAIVVVFLIHTAALKELVGSGSFSMRRHVSYILIISDIYYFNKYPIYFCAILEYARQDEDEGLEIEDYEAGEEIDVDNEIPKDVEPISKAVEGDKFEGDEILTDEQKAAMGIGSDRDLMERELEIRQAYNRARKWPKKNGKAYVPYVLGAHFTSKEKKVMARAFEEYERNTCIRYSNWI